MNVTLQVPIPPALVVTITSPLPLMGPDIAIILLGLFHSADNRQSKPHMVKPVMNYLYFGEVEYGTITYQIVGFIAEVFPSYFDSSAWWPFIRRYSSDNRGRCHFIGKMLETISQLISLKFVVGPPSVV